MPPRSTAPILFWSVLAQIPDQKPMLKIPPHPFDSASSMDPSGSYVFTGSHLNTDKSEASFDLVEMKNKEQGQRIEDHILGRVSDGFWVSSFVVPPKNHR